MSKSRDTQFAGFATALIGEIDEIVELVRQWAEEQKIEDEERLSGVLKARVHLLLKRRAYDLACHVASHAVTEKAGALLETELITVEEVVEIVPDMAELPEEEER